MYTHDASAQCSTPMVNTIPFEMDGAQYCSHECLREVTQEADAYVAREVASITIKGGESWGMETVAVTRKLQQSKLAREKQRLLEERERAHRHAEV